MSSPDSAKLSKKQRKALAFRERKGKRLQDQLDLPEVDVADEETSVPSPHTSTKRKREEGEDASLKATNKNPKQSSSGDSESTRETEASETPAKKVKKNNRYILFVGAYVPVVQLKSQPTLDDLTHTWIYSGNLSYKTSLESIQAHFASCPDPPSIRLLTPKPNASRPNIPVSKSKGCAFLEFFSSKSLQHALTLHHSVLDERTINVELTSGGGGSGEKRRETLKARNKALDEERQVSPISHSQLHLH